MKTLLAKYYVHLITSIFFRLILKKKSAVKVFSAPFKSHDMETALYLFVLYIYHREIYKVEKAKGYWFWRPLLAEFSSRILACDFYEIFHNSFF